MQCHQVFFVRCSYAMCIILFITWLGFTLVDKESPGIHFMCRNCSTLKSCDSVLL